MIRGVATAFFRLVVTAHFAHYYIRDPKGNLIEEAPGSLSGNTGSNDYVVDGLGSVVVVTGGSSSNDSYQYDAFGQTVSSAGSIQNPWEFAGQYRDPSGLYKMGARYYDPSSGRWTQQDSVVNPFDQHQSNRYDYVGDDPVNLVDPSGTLSCNASEYVPCIMSWASSHKRQLSAALLVARAASDGCSNGSVGSLMRCQKPWPAALHSLVLLAERWPRTASMSSKNEAVLVYRGLSSWSATASADVQA